MSLKRGIFISFGRTGVSFLIQFASNVIIARLLLPAEIGIFSVAVAATTLLHALRDFGVGRYLIKEKELSKDKIRTVFGMAILISWSLAAVIFFGRPLYAAFYREELIGDILALIAINFVILPFGQPALVLLRRELRYGRVAFIQLTAAALGAIVSITSAFLGHGPMALAHGALANVGSTVVLSLASRPDHILMLPSLKEWRSVSSFGGIASLSTLIVNIGMQAPELLLGRWLGFAAVGLYSRGMGLSVMFERFFVHSLTFVTGVELAARRRANESAAPMVLRAIDYTLVVGWPFLLLLAFKAEAVIFILFGENWLPAAPLVEALCVARGIQLIVSQAGAVYEGTGAVRLQLRNEIIIQFFSILLLVIGAQISLIAVAWLRALLGVITVLVHMTVYRRYVAIGFGEIFHAAWRAGLISLSLAGALVVARLLEPTALKFNILFLAGEALVFGLLYIGLNFAFRHPVRNEILRFAGLKNAHKE